MNDLKERYVETALDELYNGGPAPELEARILREAPRPTAHTRWWLIPAACAALAALVACVVILPRQQAETEALSPVSSPTADSGATPTGLGSKYSEANGGTAENGGPEKPRTPEADEHAPITADFVQKDVHVVMHYIALRTGLTIIVEGDIGAKLTFHANRQDARELIRTICRENNLDCVEDGDVIIIKRRPEEGKLAKVVGEGEDFVADPNAPITVDFVQKDIHSVMHYIALRSGLQIIIEGDLDTKLTIMFRDIDPKQAIQSICKANKLDYIEDGNVIIIKARAGEAQSHVTRSDPPARFNVDFEDYELVAAIMEVATVTKTQVFVPAVPDHKDGSAPGPNEERDLAISQMKVNLYMKLATPDQILRKLAELGGLDIEQVATDDGPQYKFTYRE